jgi:hypothetical protein
MITQVIFDDWPVEQLPYKLTNRTSTDIIFSQANYREHVYVLKPGMDMMYAFDEPEELDVLEVSIEKKRVSSSI